MAQTLPILELLFSKIGGLVYAYLFQNAQFGSLFIQDGRIDCVCELIILIHLNEFTVLKNSTQ